MCGVMSSRVPLTAYFSSAPLKANDARSVSLIRVCQPSLR